MEGGEEREGKYVGRELVGGRGVGGGKMMKRPAPQVKHITSPEWKGPEGKPTHLTLRLFYQPAIATIKARCRLFQIFLTGQTCKRPRAWRCHQMVIDTIWATKQKSTCKPPPAPWEVWNCRSRWAVKCMVHHEKQVYISTVTTCKSQRQRERERERTVWQR